MREMERIVPSLLVMEEKKSSTMYIPFFHDRDYGGFFAILHGQSGRRVLFVSDSDVDNADGSVHDALDLYGRSAKFDRNNPYHLKRLGLLA